MADSNENKDPKTTMEVGDRMMLAIKALEGRRLTPETEANLQEARQLMEKGKHKEAIEAWNRLYFHGKVFPGYDFYSPSNADGCREIAPGRFTADCDIKAAESLRKGDIAVIGKGVTICVEKIEEASRGDLPCLRVEGKKHDSDSDEELETPWHRGMPPGPF